MALRFAVRIPLIAALAGALALSTTAQSAHAGLRFGEEPSRTMLFGAYTPPAPEAGLEAVHVLEGQLGRRIDIVSWYQHWGGWGAEFTPEWVATAATGGRIPLLTWEPWAPGAVDQPDYRLARIAGGEFDGYITRWANAMATYGGTVYLRPMHEMNGDWYPWGGTVNANSPTLYIAAWQRIHGIFQAAGATNVRWVWSPMVESSPDVPGNALERYYPGTEFVDVLALDGYNWGADAVAYGGWRSFDEVFAAAYARIARLGPQPVWIAETGASATGGDKAGWVRDMFASAPSYARLEAIVWFNLSKERDWRATSSPEVAAAFAATGA